MIQLLTNLVLLTRLNAPPFKHSLRKTLIPLQRVLLATAITDNSINLIQFNFNQFSSDFPNRQVNDVPSRINYASNFHVQKFWPQSAQIPFPSFHLPGSTWENFLFLAFVIFWSKLINRRNKMVKFHLSQSNFLTISSCLTFFRAISTNKPTNQKSSVYLKLIK